MKFRYEKNSSKKFSLEAGKNPDEKKDSNKNWLLILAISLTLVFTASVGIYLTFKLDVDYQFTNKPQVRTD